ncbi:MAG: sugar phosphate isomerase/epimerase family protein [Clostridiaceae bacterium]|nr:sugar phosphate isomerase/epimerase family protein [Clostridiaceae bacterium]
MTAFKIGVMSECFGLGLEGGIKRAAQIGAQGVQLYALTDAFNCHLPQSRKSELKSFIKNEGLVISALCSEMGGFAGNTTENQRKVEETRRIMDFAAEMDTRIVTAHIGVVPENHGDPIWIELQNMLGLLGEYGQKNGVTFAVETGPEPAVVLKGLLDTIAGVGVNLDPANLVMVAGDDPVQATYTLARYIVHTHAKDGIKLHPAGGEPGYQEMALGEGAVDFTNWLRALREIGYNGFLTIEREVGQDPAADIVKAIRFLRELL